jgi:hypothetical protein
MHNFSVKAFTYYVQTNGTKLYFCSFTRSSSAGAKRRLLAGRKGIPSRFLSESKAFFSVYKRALGPTWHLTRGLTVIRGSWRLNDYSQPSKAKIKKMCSPKVRMGQLTVTDRTSRLFLLQVYWIRIREFHYMVPTTISFTNSLNSVDNKTSIDPTW